MTWRQTRTVDETLVLEGPSNDTVILNINNDSPTDGIVWTGWTWTGQVRSADGLTVIGNFTCTDTGTTSTALVLVATLALVSGQTLTPGLEYIGGIRGVKGSESVTWVEMRLFPEISAVA